MNVVLHIQSPFAAAIACGDPEKIDFNVIIEVPLYIGAVASVPCLPPRCTVKSTLCVEASDLVLNALDNRCASDVGSEGENLHQASVVTERCDAGEYENACKTGLKKRL